MELATVKMDMTGLVRDRLTVGLKLVGVRRFTLRLRVALFVIRVAAAISPVPFVIDTDDSNPS